MDERGDDVEVIRRRLVRRDRWWQAVFLAVAVAAGAVAVVTGDGEWAALAVVWLGVVAMVEVLIGLVRSVPAERVRMFAKLRDLLGF